MAASLPRELRYANLAGHDLSGVNLANRNLVGADLRRANLRSATLAKANLVGADLRNADLTGANLRYASLQGALMSGADLADADLTGADLRGASPELLLRGLQRRQRAAEPHELWSPDPPPRPKSGISQRMMDPLNSGRCMTCASTEAPCWCARD